MRRLILVATLVVAGFVGLHSAAAAQSGVHATTATHAAVASHATPMCGALPFGC